MRTTIDLPPEIHRELRKRAIDLHSTMSQLASDLLKESLLANGPQRPVVTTGPRGLKPIRVGRPVTSADVAAMEDEW